MPEPIVFKSQDADFRLWVREHPEGRLVNVPSMRLHTPQCGHIGDFRTKAAKACADGPTALADLRVWAKGTRLLLCETCEP